MQVAKWNYDRDNTNFDKDLERRMLAEEAQEFKDALNDYFDVDAEAKKKAIVDMVDAWADFKFVLQGSYYKHLGSNISFNFGMYESQLEYMKEILCDLGVYNWTLNECYKAVIDANNAKGTAKVDGKIQKGEFWRDPKETIYKILLDEEVFDG